VIALIARTTYLAILIGGTFLSDDWMILDWTKGLKVIDLSAWTTLWRESGFIRPLPLIWWKIDQALWGDSPAPFYVGSLLFHSANALLLYRLAKLCTLDQRRATFAAALYYVWPVGAYAVGWLSVRYDLMATFFGLLFLIFFLRWNEKRGTLLGVGAALALVSALLSKENSVALPFIALALYWLVNRSEKTSLPRWAIKLVQMLIITAGYVAMRLLIFGDIGGYRDTSGSIHESLLPDNPLRMAIAFAQGFLYPVNLLYLSELNIFLRLAVLAVTLIFLGMVLKSWFKIVREKPKFLLLVLLPMLPIATHLGVEGEFKDARFFYLATPFIALAIAWVTDSGVKRAGLLVLAGGLLMVNIAAHLDAYRLIGEIDRQVGSRLTTSGPWTHYRFENVPTSSNGVYIYRNGFTQRFGLTKADASAPPGEVEPLDVRTLIEADGKRRNLSTFDPEGVWRKE